MKFSKIKLFSLIVIGIASFAIVVLYVNNNLYRTRASTLSYVVSGNQTLSADLAAEGIHIAPGATLTLDPTKSVTITSTQNIIVEGKLVSKPSNPSVVHTIRFVGVDETKMVGGGMDPIDADVGLWVMGEGKLDAVGSSKTAWTRAQDSIPQGVTQISLQQAPVGWQVGDEIVIVPTAQATDPQVDRSYYDGFEERAITAINGSTITLNSPTTHSHPKTNTWTAEVLNLSRNVRIEGTPTGRTHVFMRSTVPQTLNYVAARYLGPRKQQPKTPGSSLIIDKEVLGRWGIHFHMAHEGSQGSIVEGTVARDFGGHSFAAHRSHGVIFRGDIAYNVKEHAFWWDDGGDHSSNDIIWEDSVAARISTGQSDPFSVSGFYLSKGERNIIRNVVAIGAGGSEGAGIIRPAECCGGDWATENMLSHNNQHAGLKVYTNTSSPAQVISGLSAYHSNFGIDHGAYQNSYIHKNFTLYGNRTAGVNLRAVSNNAIIRFTDGLIDAGGYGSYGVTNGNHIVNNIGQHTVFERLTMRGHTKAAIGFEQVEAVPDLVDFVNTTIEGNEVFIADNVSTGVEIRFQDSVRGTIAVHHKSQPGELVPAWNATKVSIAPFATPTLPTITPLPTPTITPIPTPTRTLTSTPAPSSTPTPLPTTTPLPTPTPTPGSTTLNLNLLLHGIGRGGDSANPGSLGNTNPIRVQRNVTVEVLNSSNALVVTRTGSVNFDSISGSFKGIIDLGSSFPAGLYTVKVKSDQFLRKVIPGIQNITQGQTNTLPQATLTTGDMNNDNRIDILDYNVLVDCYSDLTPARNCSDVNKKLNADLTDDSDVNQFDYNLFLRELTNIVGE